MSAMCIMDYLDLSSDKKGMYYAFTFSFISHVWSVMHLKCMLRWH